jgi:hypothetical protein
MPSRVYRLGVGLALVAVAFAITEVVLRFRAPGATRANARRIQLGMSRAEVERILGGPGEVEGSELDGEWSSRIHAWRGPEGTVYVYLGHRRSPSGVDEGRGVVRRVSFSPRAAGTGLLPRLRAWFGW